MIHIHNIQGQASRRRRRLVRLGIWLLACALLLPAGAQAQAPVPPAARELSHAFTSVAR